MRLCVQTKETQRHMAGEQSKHLSSYLYDAVAEALTTAGVQPHSHPFVSGSGQSQSATITISRHTDIVWVNTQRKRILFACHYKIQINWFWFIMWSYFSHVEIGKPIFLPPKLQIFRAKKKQSTSKYHDHEIFADDNDDNDESHFHLWQSTSVLSSASRNKRRKNGKWPLVKRLAVKLEETSYLLYKMAILYEMGWLWKTIQCNPGAVIREK